MEAFLTEYGSLILSAVIMLIQIFIIHRLSCEKDILTCIKEDTKEIIKPVLAEELAKRVEQLERVLLGIAGKKSESQDKKEE